MTAKQVFTANNSVVMYQKYINILFQMICAVFVPCIAFTLCKHSCAHNSVNSAILIYMVYCYIREYWLFLQFRHLSLPLISQVWCHSQQLNGIKWYYFQTQICSEMKFAYRGNNGKCHILTYLKQRCNQFCSPVLFCFCVCFIHFWFFVCCG